MTLSTHKNPVTALLALATIAGVPVAGAAQTSSTTTAAPAQAATDPARAGVFNCPASGGRQEVGAVAGGAVGALVGRALGGDNKTLGTIIGAVAGAAAGSWIGCRLQISDQAKAQAALERALAENKSQTWSSPTGARGSVELVSDMPATIDLGRFAPGVTTLPSYTHTTVGPHVARVKANLRAGPSTSTQTLGSLRKGEAVNVIAEAPGSSWALVEQGGVARGYVARSLLNRTGSAPAVQPVSSCKTVRESVSPLGGSAQTSTHRACPGADGTWTLTQI